MVPDARLLSYCHRDGPFVLDHDEVASWEQQFMQKKKVTNGVARAAQRSDT